MSDSGYGFLDKLLHRLALQSASVAELSFDLDQRMVKTDPEKIRNQRHVFVSGLARAGTTVLMRRFHDTGLYRSLTYRDMPFVLAPNLWQLLTTLSKNEIENVERAHGDKLLVNADSPESLDEVFWRIFTGNQYIKSKQLIPYQPSAEMIEKYVGLVNAILSAQTSRCNRYLSKNNNNILRLGAIHQAFPNALILIPFREPLQHAYSLLRQHTRFSQLQEKSGFTLSYMTWLCHHEFGIDHRPILPGRSSPPGHPTNTLNYWLQLWCNTYSWLEISKPECALFVCYEDLCTREEEWNSLAELADISVEHKTETPFKSSNIAIRIDVDQELMENASLTYERLVTQVRAR